MEVYIADYTREWIREFKKEVEVLEEVLDENLVQIFHIGSTAVSGLAAKPIIDMLPVVVDIGLIDKRAGRLKELGYEGLGEKGIPGRRFFCKGSPVRTHHIHIFQYDNVKDIMRHLALRNYLREHKEIRKEYEALKRELALQYPKDIEGYCDGKSSYIQKLEREALRWQWRSV